MKGRKGKLKRPAAKRRPSRPRKRSLPPIAAARDTDAIREQIERAASRKLPRWNADPEDVRRSVMKLVLTLVELIRQILERQAVRRMENQTLTEEETENVGMALMRLQETVLDLAAQFDIDASELTLDLGPIGRLQ